MSIVSRPLHEGFQRNKYHNDVQGLKSIVEARNVDCSNFIRSMVARSAGPSVAPQVLHSRCYMTGRLPTCSPRHNLWYAECRLQLRQMQLSNRPCATCIQALWSNLLNGVAVARRGAFRIKANAPRPESDSMAIGHRSQIYVRTSGWEDKAHPSATQMLALQDT